jgi:uncharacterized damage-inducible protein DinB
VNTIQRLLAYDQWANGEALTSLEKAPYPPKKGVAIMNHVLAVELNWLERLGYRTSFEKFLPENDLSTLRNAWKKDLPAHWKAFLGNATLSDPTRVVEYRNTKGEPWKGSVEDILLHVVLHSAHHRGQVAAEVRAAGGTPAVTDFVHATRTGLVR